MNLQAIKKQSAENLTVNSLRNAITSGKLPAGTRITEMELADQFQVSRGTVRIALFQLMREGIIEQTPYTGWSVTMLTPHDVWELYPLRAKLEALGAQLAAERIDDEGRAALTGAYDRLAAACGTGDKTRVAELDFELHRTIIALSKNSRLVNHYQLIEQQFTDLSAMRTMAGGDPADDALLERFVGGCGAGEPTAIKPEISTTASLSTAAAFYYAWHGITRFDHGLAQVNLFLNRASPWMDVESYLPFEGKVILRNKQAEAAVG